MGGDRNDSHRSSAAPTPPTGGDYVELAGGILWVRLPIPGGLKHINVWLLPCDGGWHLVDTGMDTADVRRAWASLELRLPLRRELQGIVVTHHHPDHFGMARWLAERYSVPVVMTRAAQAAANAALAKETTGAPSHAEEFAWRFGLQLDDDTRRILRGGTYRSIVSGTVDALPIEAGSPLGQGAGQWRVSVHDGHAPGHACFHDAAAGILVSGDQLLPAISSNISLYPSNEHEDPLGQYLDSLQALGRLPVDTLVLPSHGLPFSSLHARADALREEHATRLRRVHELTSDPANTLQVAAKLFRLERLDALNRLLATTETLAHLRWLEMRGMIVRSGEGPGLRWTATGAATGSIALQQQ